MPEVEMASSITSATTEVPHIPSLFCPEDDSTLGSASVDYEMSENEKWGIFVDAMCDVDFEEGDDTSFNTLVAGISQNLTQDGASEVSTLNTPSQRQDTATASTITQSQAEFMSQPMRVPRQIITRQSRANSMRQEVASTIHSPNNKNSRRAYDRYFQIYTSYCQETSHDMWKEITA